jgi:hypothetical protein
MGMGQFDDDPSLLMAAIDYLDTYYSIITLLTA